MTLAHRLSPELLAIIAQAMRDVPPHMRDLFLTDVQDRLRPLDHPEDYVRVRAAVAAALARLRDDDD